MLGYTSLCPLHAHLLGKSYVSDMLRGGTIFDEYMAKTQGATKIISVIQDTWNKIMREFQDIFDLQGI